MSVLVAVEEKYYLLREVLAQTIERARPDVEVHACEIEQIARHMEVVRPDVVICGRREPKDPGDVGQLQPEERMGWVELFLVPTLVSRICVGGNTVERLDPGVQDVVAVLDEVEKLRSSEHNLV